MTDQTPTPNESAIVPVSEETKALVEQKIGDEPDEIKQKLGELIDLIKKRAETELQSAEEMTRETYLKAMSEAKETLQKIGDSFQDQEKTLDRSINDLTTEATEKWDKIVKDVKTVSNRLDRAVEAAWKVLTEEEESK